MPARILPSLKVLLDMVARGMTHAQIAEAVSKETGYRVSRSAVSAALSRAGETVPPKKYHQELPWSPIHMHHRNHYAHRMLQALGRRNAGEKVSEVESKKLDSWLARNETNGVVVVYVPETEEGFFYVQGTPDVPGIPVSTINI